MEAVEKTPYFLIDQEELDDNIRIFQTALKKYWPNSALSYSVKTNSLPWVLSHMRKRGVMAEVVSAEEFQLAILCGYKPEEMIFNGPIKEKTVFYKALEEGAVVNVDSEKELDWLNQYSLKKCAKVGVRVNFDLSPYCAEDLSYAEEGLRFGFSYENGELHRALKEIAKKYPAMPIGLHVHCNSNTRSLHFYRTMAKLTARVIQETEVKVAYLDMGGGFFGGVPGKPTAEEYVGVIADELGNVVNKEEVPLYIEPGSALIASPVSFVSSVIDAKEIHRGRIVTTDASRVMLDPLWRKKSYLYQTLANADMPVYEGVQTICGYTCMEHDRIMHLKDKPLLQVGDKIIYQKVGGYTVTLGGPFIQYYPEVYVKSGEGYTLIRRRMDAEDYLRIHGVLGQEIL